ncbi:MAG: SAM-dependent methyltransferase [Nitrosomonadales bacterium]|nr:SAM-dependent methyltransferase [Nitrosomonadales bacterium]
MPHPHSATLAGSPLLAVSVLSAAALGYEILLTRMLSIIQWHHFAYMMISVALLGYGVAGACVAVAKNWLLARYRQVFAAAAALFGISAIACFLAVQEIGFNPLEILWDPGQLLRLAGVYALLAVPFFFAALCVCLTFTSFPAEAHRVYSADIVGAGIGSMGVILALYALMPVAALKLLCLLALLASVLVWRKAIGAGLACAAAAILLLLPAEALRLSDYKDLPVALRAQGARIISEKSSPLGLITVVENNRIPFRHAPGMSLNAAVDIPAQLGVFTDGDGLSPITRFDGRREPLAYLDFLTSALPYHLLHQPDVLVLGAGTGSDLLQAYYHRASRVDAVEINPQMVDLVQRRYGSYSGQPYSLPGVSTHIGEARGFVAGSRASWGLIQIALLDSFGASSAGLHALSENYLYTVEGLREYLRHLTPGGLLAFTRWVSLPPRDTLKLFATAVAALRQSGVADPAAQLVLVRGWKTATLLVKNGAFAVQEIALIRKFCRARSFDVDYFPGIGADEVNRYNQLDRPYFHEGAMALLGAESGDFLARYKFNVAPATDDNPYFFHFFKWRSLPEFFRLKEQGGLPLLEWGYPILAATLLQAVLASAALILLPLWLARKSELANATGRSRAGGYFALLGCAFMFLEIAYIQKFILFLSHPLYAVGVVLCAFLIFAGLGSRYALRWEHEGRLPPVVVAAISAIAAVYLALLPVLFADMIALPDWARIALSLALIAPLAFFMGMPFPLGMARMGRIAPQLVPWLWGINACTSVVSAILATLLAIHLGFNAVVLAGIGMYWLALKMFPRDGVKPLSGLSQREQGSQ